MASPIRDEQSAGRAGDRQHETLGQQLPHESAAPGAEGEPDAHLPTARDGARKEEIGDIGTDDEQQERHAGHQDQKRSMKVTSDSRETPRAGRHPDGVRSRRGEHVRRR